MDVWLREETMWVDGRGWVRYVVHLFVVELGQRAAAWPHGVDRPC